jgi:hypothetical protein
MTPMAEASTGSAGTSGASTGSAGTVGWAPPGRTPGETNLVLWGIGTSRTFRAHWMLAEMALPYVSRRIQSRTGETMQAEYLRLNPRHKIPLLQHDPLVMTEAPRSSSILPSGSRRRTGCSCRPRRRRAQS